MITKDRRFPEILSKEVVFALHLLRSIEKDGYDGMKLLEIFRKNRINYIAENGISGKREVTIPDFAGIPPQYLMRLNQIDEAFQKFHEYRSKPGTYVAADVVTEVYSLTHSSPRAKKVDDQAIIDYLKRRNYKNADPKKPLIFDAMEYFGVSESTVKKLASRAGLTKK